VEVELGTEPYYRDTDGDGVEDGVEVAIGTNPLVANDSSLTTDTDRDRLPDMFDLNTDNPDSDGDGYGDGYELASGFNPADPASKPSLGDVNGSGGADVVDAVVMFNVLLGNFNPEDVNMVSEDVQDVNRDQKVDTVDAVILMNWYLGNIKYLPYP
jgi:hypothetical protein